MENKRDTPYQKGGHLCKDPFHNKVTYLRRILYIKSERTKLGNKLCCGSYTRQTVLFR